MSLHKNRKYAIGFDPNRPLPVLVPGGRYRESGHLGYGATCDVCKVSAKISERALVDALERGLAEQKLTLASLTGPGESDGNLRGALAPLMEMLSRKGFKVTKKPY
jgi:hypothetical protein